MLEMFEDTQLLDGAQMDASDRMCCSEEGSVLVILQIFCSVFPSS